MRPARTARMIPVLMVVCLLTVPAPAQYSGGSGTAEDPYQIATAADLIALGETPDDYDKHFILTADIDLAENLPRRRVFDKAVIAPDTDPNDPFQSQDTPFAGIFDGNGHTISHLTIVGGGNLGLFGELASTGSLSNLGLEAVEIHGAGDCVGGLVGFNCGGITASYSTGTVSGHNEVGGLVGYNRAGVIVASHSTGQVAGAWRVGGLAGCNSASVITSYSTSAITGDDHIGGLVGANEGEVITSYSTGTVSGYDNVGGLVGVNHEGFIATSYSTGVVGGAWRVGGLVGYNYGHITTSYSTAAVNGDGWVGGLVGSNDWGGSVAMTYSVGEVSGDPDEDVGGLVGSNDWGGIVAASFWDKERSGWPSSADGTGLKTAEMQDIAIFLNAGWDFVGETHNGTCDYWRTIPGDCPRLRYHIGDDPVMPEGLGTIAQPYLIRDARDLGTVWFEPTAHYRLDSSVDLSGITWSVAVIPWFDGAFDGNGHVIGNLHIQGHHDLGLFALLGAGAIVSDLGLEAVDVNGIGNDVGGLAGINEGHITASYTTGAICGAEAIGGLVGWGYGGSINNSHSACTVSGDWGVGGLVGLMEEGLVTMGHSVGMVSGNKHVGGLVGHNGEGCITTSYSAATATGTEGVGGLTGGNGGNVTLSFSMGVASGNRSVGGLTGKNREGRITGSYSTATVTGNVNVGGLVGSNEDGGVVASYSMGGVSGELVVGGLVGDNARGSVSASFWDTETSGQSSSDGGAGLMTIEMLDINTFLTAGWDFVDETENGTDDIWKMWDGYDYPRLAWEPGPSTPLVFVDINDPGLRGQMSRYEVTNAQYCDFLNAALASGDVTANGADVEGAGGSNAGVDYVGQRYYRCDGSGYTGYGATNGGAARIHYNEGAFSVDEGFGNHPVTYVSWYGAMAFCSYYGYCLPTEDQWQAVADYDGTYIYGCGETIDPGIANYRDSAHPDGTVPVGSYGLYGYGMSDMAGNVWEWTSSGLDSNRIFRGGSMGSIDSDCDVSIGGDGIPYANYWDIGFRVCR